MTRQRILFAYYSYSRLENVILVTYEDIWSGGVILAYYI